MVPEAHYTDFMCSCSDKGKTRCEEVVERVDGALGTSFKKGDLVTKVVYGLQWGLPHKYYGHITSVACDMWAGIRAEIMRWPEELPDEVLDNMTEEEADALDIEERKPVASIYVQCDELEPGFARLYELAVEAAEDLNGKEENE